MWGVETGSNCTLSRCGVKMTSSTSPTTTHSEEAKPTQARVNGNLGNLQISGPRTEKRVGTGIKSKQRPRK